MKKFIFILIINVGLLMASGASFAAGHGGHGGRGGFYGPSFGISVGDPFFFGPWPYYYGPPAMYYAPPPFYIGPETYIERDDASAQAPDYRYYCPKPEGYYPQIPRCPKGWLKVVPDNSQPR